MASKLAQVFEIADKVFDFVIIGGGTAGCVLAGRLSEDPSVSVVLLEAGPNHLGDSTLSDPAAFLKPVWDPGYDWQYTTVPQHAVDGQPAMFPRGKGLGGTSQINWMVYNLPHREEIDMIGKLGNEGWNWENFHKYAMKVQRFCASDHEEGSEVKDMYKVDAIGHDGPLPLSFGRDICSADALWKKSLATHGVDIISTSLDGDVSGAFKSVSNIDPQTRQRVNSADAYLVPALGRPNLKVLTGAFVTKIITSNNACELAARGVEFEYDGKICSVSARKEVILCAGAIKSPHILELSGIGDRKILEPLGINVQLDLPSVGTNMQEHISLGYTRWISGRPEHRHIGGMLDSQEFAETLQGTLGLPDSIQMALNSVSFLPIQIASERAAALVQKQKDKLAQAGDKYPPGLKEQYELQLELLADPKVPDFEILFFPFVVHFFPVPEPDKPYITFCPTLGHPFTRGTVHATSADPKSVPAIDPRYFDEDIDLDIQVDALKFTRKVVGAPPFSDVVQEELVPGPDVQTDEQIYDYVRKHTTSSWHTCGTCSMMPRDKGGVVDSRFKVYGTSNIRVVDLSVLPLHTTVHPQGTVYTIAEMAADNIKADWR